MRLILDTCVLVSAFRSRLGASRAVVDAFDLNLFDLLVSTSLLAEYEDVLTRREHTAVHGFTVQEISHFLDTVAARAIRITPNFVYHPQLRDSGDEHVLATAINGGADAIVTYNAADFLPAATNFRVRIVTPGRIIKERFQR